MRKEIISQAIKMQLLTGKQRAVLVIGVNDFIPPVMRQGLKKLYNLCTVKSTNQDYYRFAGYCMTYLYVDESSELDYYTMEYMKTRLRSVDNIKPEMIILRSEKNERVDKKCEEDNTGE